jgi:predicted methyltransferase
VEEVITTMDIITIMVRGIFSAVAMIKGAMRIIIVNVDLQVVRQRTLAEVTWRRTLVAVAVKVQGDNGHGKGII